MLRKHTLPFNRRRRLLTNAMFTFILTIIWTTALGLESFSSSDALDVIRRAGYSGEEHRVHTQDGYILTLHRILPAATRRLTARTRPVLLQHGLLSSSYFWLDSDPEDTLPFLLSDAGYDVWLGNSRGNFISREHKYLSPNGVEFWDFSFHEMGVYDLPAVIEYMLNATAREQISYIGHSMGTTMFFVMASSRPDVAAKVHSSVALAPIAVVSPIYSYLRPIVELLGKILSLVIWTNTEIDILTARGISTKTILHFIQLYLTGQFASYDYGIAANMQIYTIPKPPQYRIADISVPMFLYYGTKDPFSTAKDVNILNSLLADVVGIWSVPLTHLDFLGGKYTKELFKNIIVQLHQ